MKSEPRHPQQSPQTRDAASLEEASLDQDQLTQREAPSSTEYGDQPMTSDEGPSITVAGDDGTTIRVASQGTSGVKESIVVLGDGAAMRRPLSGAGSGSGPGLSFGTFGGAQTTESMSAPGDGVVLSAMSAGTTHTPNGTPSLLPRQPEDDLSTTGQPDLGPPSNSTQPTNLSSSPPTSTPRISHLSSESDQPTSYHFSSSPLSSPPPILSDPYDSSSLERAYSQSEFNSAASVSSSTDSEETDQTDGDSGSSTPYFASQSSFNSSQPKTTLPNLKGRDLFDASIWADPIKTSVFYTFATTLRQKARDVSPTSSHLFLSVLRDQRKLVRCYTQNIDRLEDRIGLSTSLELGTGSRARFSAKAWRNSGSTGIEGKGPSPKDDGSVPAGDEGEGEAGLEARAAASARQTQADDSRGGAGGGEQENEIQVLQGHGVPPGCSESASFRAAVARVQQQTPTSLPASLRRPGSGSNSATPTRNNCGQPSNPQGQGPDEPEPGGESGRRQLPREREGDFPGPEPDAGAPLPPAQTPTLSAPNRGVECVFLHGSLESLRCFLCGLTSSWDDNERELETLAGRQPTCPHCAGATAAREERGKRALGVGKLRPDIVLYGEEHPRSDLIGTIVQHDLSLGPDMLLILGTSLRVHGLKTVVREFAKAVHSKGGKVVFVNFTKPPDSVWSDIIDFWVQSDCDAWVLDIKTRKPALWLPPGTALEDEETKPSRSKRASNGGSTSIRRGSSGLSVSSDKESAKNGKAKRKSNGDSTKLQRQDSSLSTVQESINVSGASASNNASIDASPSVSYISDGPPAEQSIAVKHSAGSRGRRPPHSVHVRRVFESMEASKQGSVPSPPETALVENNIDETNEPKVTAKRNRKSLPTGSGFRPAPYREVKLNPNAKRPQAIRDEVQNGAHLSWKILEDLKRLTGQPKPSFMFSTPPPPPAKITREKKPRKSAPAVLTLESKLTSGPLPLEEAPWSQIPLPPQYTEETQLPFFGPISNPSSVTSMHRATGVTTQHSPAMSLPLAESTVPFSLPLMPSSSNRTAEGQGDSLTNSLQLSTDEPKAKRGKTAKPRPKKVTIPRQPDVETELPQQPPPFTSTSTIPVVSPSSIGAAIKTNPRKRKRKTIDGIEVMLPNEGRRLAARTRVPRPNVPLPSPQPQTPLLQAPHTPRTPHIILPIPRPSVTPVTPRSLVTMELQRVQEGLHGLEHGTLELPKMHNGSPPEVSGACSLAAMEPEPTVGPLPVSKWRHKLADFFVGPGPLQVERVVLAPSECAPPNNPFFLHNPLNTLPYQSRPASIVSSRAGSPDPSQQLRSEQRTSEVEAALMLAMFRHGVSPAVAAEYLEDRRQLQYGRPRYGNRAVDARYKPD